jgi:hypothetical protein
MDLSGIEKGAPDELGAPLGLLLGYMLDQTRFTYGELFFMRGDRRRNVDHVRCPIRAPEQPDFNIDRWFVPGP